MDVKDIRELIQFVSDSGFETFELEQDGTKIKLVRGEGSRATVATASAVPAPAAPLAAASAADEAGAASVAAAQTSAAEEGLHELHSPIVGTFYAAPGPDAPNFVERGAKVQKGQVLCIVEAMKVMNEIESEIDGEIVDVLVKNGQPVEFGEILFRLRPV